MSPMERPYRGGQERRPRAEPGGTGVFTDLDGDPVKEPMKVTRVTDAAERGWYS